MTETHERQFTGWWIPRKVVELFESSEINAKEMILLAMIDSLSKSNEGCFASNEYFGKILHLTTRGVTTAITKLKEMGLVVPTGFDGRNRYLKTTWTEQLEQEKADYTKTSRQPRQKRLGCLDKNVQHIEKTISPRSKINLRTRGTKQVRAVRTGFHSSEFDQQAAARLREVLVIYGSDLVTPPGVVRLQTLASSITRLRMDRKVSEQDIRRVIKFLKDNYEDQYTPKLRRANDLFVHWEKFRDAANRHENNGDGEISDTVKRTAEWKRKVALIDKIREKAVEIGYLNNLEERSSAMQASALPKILEAIGEKRNVMSYNFFVSMGREN